MTSHRLCLLVLVSVPHANPSLFCLLHMLVLLVLIQLLPSLLLLALVPLIPIQLLRLLLFISNQTTIHLLQWLQQDITSISFVTTHLPVNDTNISITNVPIVHTT